MAPFTFCRVCRINHDKGKGHKYGVKHKQYLAEFLSKARTKTQDIRSSLKAVATQLQDEDRGRTKFWCSFCELEVDDKDSAFARESAIQHVGSSSHVTCVKNFLSEQGARVADSHRYFISEDELSKWQERCKIATMARASAELSRTNNIHSDTSHCDPGSALALRYGQTVFKHIASVEDVQPLPVLTVGSSQRPLPMYDGGASPSVMATAHGDQRCFLKSAAIDTSRSSSNLPGGVAEVSTSKSSHGYYPETLNGSFDRSRGVNTTPYTQAPGAHWPRETSAQQHIIPSSSVAATSQYTVMAIGQDLAKIVCPPLRPGEGNVHSGAPPPWMGPSDDTKLLVVAPSTETGPSMETLNPNPKPLSKTQERKLAKLRPPNRVGAAWADMRRAQLERADGVPLPDATWLPNFGRVWQSGSRHDTRKEFEAEKRRENKRLGRPLGKRGAPSLESPLPYVSKRQQSPPHVQPYVSKRQRVVKTDE